MFDPPHNTAFRETCILETPNPIINAAFQYAKDNIARCIRNYTLGWGMSNCPHASTIVVGRDTGWMCLGADYVAPWFSPAALLPFRQRQKRNGQIVEYIDLETGSFSDYGLNVSDNTPLCLWALWHHWKQYGSEDFRQEFLPMAKAACEHILKERADNGLLYGYPAGLSTNGTTSWRNIIPDYMLAGEVTEINSLSAMALRLMGEFTQEERYTDAAEEIKNAVNTLLYKDGHYFLNVYSGIPDYQVTGDMIFPALTGIANKEQALAVLKRLGEQDFWCDRGMRTLPCSDVAYHPANASGLLGGSWPNLTLWYAAAAAPYDADAALKALEMIASPVVENLPAEDQVNRGEFAEYFHGDSGINLGMRLSPWVAPTFLWAVMEGLLGLKWEDGEPTFQPNWPSGWQKASIKNLPCKSGLQNIQLTSPN